MYSAKEIREYTRELSVLYVEDDASIQEEMRTLLGMLFKEVLVANDGLEGVEMFEKHSVDLIITDIQMPRMNGLQMAAEIKNRNAEIPIIVTTAYGDQKYFIESINLGIDKYLLKPIEQESAKRALYRIAKNIDLREKAKTLEKLRQEQALLEASERMLHLITDSYPNPCIVCNAHVIKYVNQAFLNAFGFAQGIVDGCHSLEVLFDKREGYLGTLADYDFSDLSRNKISVTMPEGRKIFQIIIKPVALDPQSSDSVITFNDITWSEYQKIKLKNYSEMLEEYIFLRNYKGKGCKTAQITAPLQAEESGDITPEIPHDETASIKLDKERTDLLRRSHLHKTSAGEYIAELDDDTLLELQELDELDGELKECIEDYDESQDPAVLNAAAQHLSKYANKISLLFAFEDLCFAINSLAELLSNSTKLVVDEKKSQRLGLLLSGIQSDLQNWREVVFIAQETQDIHYLDSSLFSTCLQIEMLLSDTLDDIETEDDEDNDLILF